MLKANVDCKGYVTDIDKKFLFFELDNNVRVHMSILMSQNKSQKLPLIGSKIIIKNAHKFASSYFLCTSSILKGDFYIFQKDYAFLRLVKKHKLGIADLSKLEKIMHLIELNFNGLEQNLKTKLIISVMESMIYLSEDFTLLDDTCLNKCISQFNLISVKSCKYVEIQSKKFDNYPQWSFGIHSNYKNGTLLFGHLVIQPMYGFFLLKDSHYQIVCVVYNAYSVKLSQIQDSYVLIKKYNIITEIYQETNVPNVEYIIVDLNDIIVIHRVRNTDSCLFGNNVPSDGLFKTNMHFQLKRKSMVRMGVDNASYCWFQILIMNQNNEVAEEAFLILPSGYVKTIINFKEELHYKLFYNTPLKVTNNPELNRVQKLKIYEIQEDAAYFMRVDQLAGPEKLMTVAECKKYLSNNTSNLVSFEGTLKGKRFANSLNPSNTAKKATIYGFGTPGSKVHQLVFAIENDGIVYLDCYLNSWENVLMPLGLIPQMRVAVRNVYPQSKKYVKSSPFTTFEILSYDPLIHFDTVNLYENDHLDWGQRCFLGLGNKIPYGVLIWGKTINIHILSLKITNRCAGCKRINGNSRDCVHCQLKENELHFLLKMHVSDEFGQSKVIAKCPRIMKSILDLQEHQFQVWLEAINEIECFEYNFFEDKPILADANSEEACFSRTLIEFLILVNEQAMISLDLKCRKLDSNTKTDGKRPLWFCIDARRN